VAAGATTENSARPSFSRAHNRKSNAREIIGYRKGGANTHFFHAHASIRKEAEPHIQAAQRQNVVVTDQEEMQALATTHYVDLSMYDYIARIQATLTTPHDQYTINKATNYDKMSK
jgi:hypothetical protein